MVSKGVVSDSSAAMVVEAATATANAVAVAGLVEVLVVTVAVMVAVKVAHMDDCVAAAALAGAVVAVLVRGLVVVFA